MPILQVQNKIDITAYFKGDALEEDILQVKDQIIQLSLDIKNVEYVSKEQALNTFSQKHQDNTVFSNALSEVGENPFLPSLNITTTGDVLLYQQVTTMLQGEQFSGLIDSVDFSDKSIAKTSH